VLERCYDIKKDMIAWILEKILKTEKFAVQNTELVWRALREFKKTGADLPIVCLGR
jgi:predicted nucleic-acid-binding protein